MIKKKFILIVFLFLIVLSADIAYSLPQFFNITVSPQIPQTNDNLNCTWFLSDNNNSNVNVNVTWFNGTANVNAYNSNDIACNIPHLDHLVISEVNYDDNINDSNEYVELYNPTNSSVTINSSWKIVDGNTNDSLCNAVIFPGGHYLISD